MSLELLIGPMFAGKSSAIQSIIRRHQALGWNVFVVTNSIDTRYTTEPAIVNHDKVMMPARATNNLMTLVDDPEYVLSRLVVIEEAQFFPDLVPFVLQTVDKCGKHVVVVGLDGDAERRPFGHVLDLVPHSDRVTKLTAMCKMCKDGTPAIFTFASREDAVVAANEGQPCVGADEKYVPLCRKHFNSSRDSSLSSPTFENVLNIHAC
jgi:thymidine kinase